MVNFKNSPAGLLCFIGCRQVRLTKRESSGRGHSRLLLQALGDGGCLTALRSQDRNGDVGLRRNRL
jgi:hypothetical protein